MCYLFLIKREKYSDMELDVDYCEFNTSKCHLKLNPLCATLLFSTNQIAANILPVFVINSNEAAMHKTTLDLKARFLKNPFWGKVWLGQTL